MTAALCPCGRPMPPGATWCGEAGLSARRFLYRVVHARGEVREGEIRVCDVGQVFPGMWFGHTGGAYTIDCDPRAAALILATGRRPNVGGVTASEVSVTQVVVSARVPPTPLPPPAPGKLWEFPGGGL